MRVGKPAGKLTSPCEHGGAVTMGSRNTIITGKPAARLGDAHSCPIHSPGKIVSTSRTVFINGVGAARELDEIQCDTAPSPPTVFTVQALVAGTTDGGVGEWKIGAQEYRDGGVQLGGIQQKSDLSFFGKHFNVKNLLAFGYVKGKADRTGAGVKASVFHQEASAAVQYDADNYVRVGEELDLGVGEVAATGLAGSNGEQVGGGLGRKAGVKGASFKAFGEGSLSTGWGNTLEARVEVTPRKKEIEEKFGKKDAVKSTILTAGYDRNTERFYFEANKAGIDGLWGAGRGALWGAQAGAALGIPGILVLGAAGAVAGFFVASEASKWLDKSPLDKISLSWGRSRSVKKGAAPGPDRIAMGEPTVFIGD